MEGDKQAFGRYVRERRGQLGLTQRELGDRLGWAQERISVIETGKYGTPSTPAVVRLADALEIPPQALLEAAGYRSRWNGLSPATADIDGGNPRALLYTLQQLLMIDAVTLGEALAQATDLMAPAMGADKIDAFMYEPESHTLVALGTSNTPMGHRQQDLGLDRIPLASHDPSAQVFVEGSVFYTGHADTVSEMLTGIADELGVRSLLSVPLQYGGATRGVLSAASAEPYRFSEEEQQFFLAASHWVALVAQRGEHAETLRQAAVEEVRRSTADELITSMAHDLGNYLTPLKGRVDLLRRRMKRDGREGDIEDLDALSHTVANIRRLCNDLMDAARLDTGIFSLTRQPVDLSDLVQHTADEFGGVQCRAAEGVWVDADPGRLTDVLMNLLTNAREHLAGDIPIVVSLDREEREDGDWAIVRVSDSGPGISAELLPRLFDRFAAGPASRGLGIGLYIARGIASAHGGTLSVNSVPGTGTTFQFALPCPRDPAPEA